MKFRAASFSFAFISSLMLLTSCSPGMFFGGKDQGVIATPNYRRINLDCAGINLSSSTLTVPKFREILHCFNSNGALEPIDQLVQKLSDSALQHLVDGTNKHLLSNKAKLYQIDRTYQALEDKGISDNLFFQLGKILENDELISSLIAVFQTGYSGPYVQDILRSLELISRELTHENMRFALDLGSSVASEKSFHDLREDFSKTIPASARSMAFKAVVGEVFNYIQEDHSYVCEKHPVPISRELIQSILTGQDGSRGDLFSALNEIVGASETEVQKNILPMVDIFRNTLGSNSGEDTPLLMERLSFALRDLQGPVQCMDAARSIPNASLHLIRELAELPESSDPDIAAKYVLRDTPLNLMSLGPFCSYPTQLKEHYATLVEFAKTGAVDPLAKTLKAFSRVTRPWKGCDGKQVASGEQYSVLVNWLVNFLADTGGSPAPAARAGIHRLIPSLTEVTSRGAWTNLLLVTALPTAAHQQRMKESLQYLLEPRVELDQRSIYDLLMQVIPLTQFPEVLRLAVAVQQFIQDPEPVLEPALKVLRQASYVNDAHPFLDLIRESLSQATQEKEFYDAIFEISSEPEFLESIKLLSSMGKDGRLKDLVGASVRLFHKFADEAKKDVVIHDVLEPAALPLRHHLTRADLIESPHRPVTINTSWYSPSCDALDMSFSLDQTSSASFDVQFNHFIRCQNGSGKDNDVSNALNFLSLQKAENGQSFLKYQIDQTKKFLLSPENSENKLNPTEINHLLDSWIASMDDGRFFRLLDAVPFWIAPQSSFLQSLTSLSSPGIEGPGTGLLVKPLLDVSRSIITDARGHLEELEDYAAHLVGDNSVFPKLLGDLDDLLIKLDLSVKAESLAGKEKLPPSLASLDRDQIRQWIDAKECGSLSNNSATRSNQIEKRVDEILSEAQHNVTNWDLVQAAPNQEGSPRQSWQVKEIEDLLKPIFDKFADRDKQSVPQKWVLSSFLNFTRYFSMPPDGRHDSAEEKKLFHYQPQYLLDWLYQRAIDYRLITYYYPGEEAPRVRLVNTLDMLELTLVNVDFVAPFPISKNMGLDFLSELADAWGDEPRDMWPVEIQRKYPDDKKLPRTLVAAVEDVLDRPGFPGLDNLKKLTYNFVGLPVLPACHKDIPGEKPDIQAKASAGWMNTILMSADQRKMIQRQLYNLWQVNDVLRETAANQGMRVLRDLFYEVKYSTPEKYRTAKAGDLNNLSLILKSVRLGMMRQAGRQIQKFEKTDPALQDFFQAFIHTGNSPYMLGVMDAVINSDSDHKLVWKIIHQVFDIIDTGTPVDAANMKQMVFYLMANSNRMDEWVPLHTRGHSDLTDYTLWRAYEALSENRQFWIKPEVDFLGDILTSKTLSSFARASYEDENPDRTIRMSEQLFKFLKDNTGNSGASRVHNAMGILKAVYENDQSRESFKVFKKRLDAVLALDEYKNLDLERSIRPVLRFFEERGMDADSSASPEDVALAKKLRGSFSSLLKDHSLDQILILERDNPDQFYQLLETLSRLSSGDITTGLKNFFRMLRRSLSERPY
jgi:hypothetical protein